MAGTRSETGRINAAAEIANSFLVDDVDLLSGAPAHSAVGNSKKRRPCRGDFALHQRQHRGSQRCGAQSSQHCWKRFPIPGTARREKGRRHSRVASVFPQLRIDRHTLVSLDRRRADRHLSEPARSREECGADREIQTHLVARDTNFPPRLFAQN